MKKSYKIGLLVICLLLLIPIILFALNKIQERIEKKNNQESFDNCMQEYQRFKQGDPKASTWFAGITNPEIMCRPQKAGL